MSLLLAILGVILGEIYLSIKIGQAIGAFKTVLVMVGVALAGLFLARLEIYALVNRIGREFKANSSMTDTAIELCFVVMGMILLFIPGFLTDVIAFLFIIPPTRSYFTARISPAFRRRIDDIVEKKRAEYSNRSK